ncbi:MAG: tRNA(Met) cytidine acetyltransferase [Psychrosphaera sp.]|jgi:tRNA(Met) cytidine acetyltransferase
MLNQLIEHLTQNKQRCLFWVKGEQCWAQTQIQTWLSTTDPSLQITRFGEPQLNTGILRHSQTVNHEQSQSQTQNQITDIRIKQYKKMLGQESDVLIYDCYAGLNPDALGALVGTVKLGGLCILISPEVPQWLNFLDPEYNRLCVEPYQPEQISHHYLQYFINQLTLSSTVLTISQSDKHDPQYVFENWCEDVGDIKIGSDVRGEVEGIKTHPQYNQCKTDDQYQVVKQLFESFDLRSECSTSQQALIIQADRGRGKSASLGIFSGLLLAESKKQNDSKSINIVLTAPHLASISGVFEFCEVVLKQKTIIYSVNNNALKTEFGSLTFIAPDDLADKVTDADIVLVDEAAAIPSQMLLPLLSPKTAQSQCAFVVFATTVHGYEGTGRGFEYKFKPLVAKAFNQITNLSLSQPIRWSEHDCLEADINQLLLINTHLPEFDRKNIKLINSENVSFSLLSSQDLINHSVKLEGVFGLLVNAHYRTTPNDLRNMLDGPNMQVFSLQYKGEIIGAVLLAEEGCIDPDLAEQIWQGRRRPKGHLLPQSLIAHSGFKRAGEYRYGRIVRIAIHPDLQNQGLGSLLLNKVKQAITQQGFDFICTSFGVADNLVKFWLSNQYVPVRLGLKAEASTGEYSLLMTQALNLPSKTFEQDVSTRFQQTLLVEQQLNMRHKLSERLLNMLQQSDDLTEQVTGQDAQDIACFCHNHRSLDTCILAMYRYVKSGFMSEEGKGQRISPLTIDKVINGVDNKTLIQNYKLTGEKQLVQQLRNEWLSYIN